ncbi:site-2 protease family protein [Nitrospirillum amazonense]|uniref:Zn-dependent protease n=1 Tax=Nitrospirillum amazonense TaxID=28077 RepID=A0A560K1X3_9PROT|nr:site-2 protease family protein [Nitrospirillum amazonense]MDG3443761.1 site-2 protease family protein [Nitrospirillum amazonense]TWB77321.1 Zn-dependent protease [Nitrospirillum amazonense]
MDTSIQELIVRLSVMAIPMVLAITLHEAAHAWVAWKLGDDTAYSQGRVSFNPGKHIDPIGTILMPATLFLFTGFVFGWAKPVPITQSRLRRPRRDMALVALSGPGMNFLLAIVFALLLHTLFLLPASVADWVGQNFVAGIQINLMLGVLNMLPFPSLDGGKVIEQMLPYRQAQWFAAQEVRGNMILLTIFFLLPYLFSKMGLSAYDPYMWLVRWPTSGLWNVIATVTGLS